MLTRRVVPLLLSLVLGLGGIAAARTPEEDLTPLRQVPRELIVLLDDLPSSPSPEAVVESAAARRTLPAGLGVGSPSSVRFLIPAIDRGHVDTSEEGRRLLRYLVLEYASFAQLESVKTALAANRNVAWVDFNWPFETSASPNDPYFPVTLSPTTHQWGLHSLKLPDAWDYNQGHAYVGVVDLGLESSHPDLKTYTFNGGGTLTGLGPYRRQYSTDYGYPGDNCSASAGNDCASNPISSCVDEGQSQLVSGVCRTPSRSVGHGTHVAGIVAAATDNSEGVSGSCWNCSLIVSKISKLIPIAGVYGNGGVSQADVATGLHGAAHKGAQVVNMSLGWRPTGSGELAPDCGTTPSHVLCTTLAFLRNRDIAIAAAAGNDDGPTVDFPASDSRTIAVGGIDPTGAFWDDCPGSECGSNYSATQVVAPAKQILSTFYRGIPHDPSGGSVCPGFDPYGLCTGTSMAAPHIAGAAGLLRSANPLLSADQVAHLLSSHLDNPPGWNAAHGVGKPHVANAVKAAIGKAAGVQLPNRLTPLFSLYSGGAEDHLYTTAPQMAVAALFDATTSYAPTGPPIGGYSAYPGTQCSLGPCPPVEPSASVYVFTGERAPYSGAPPLVPLYRMTFRGTNPNGNTSHRDSIYTTELAGVQVFRTTGYELDGIEGYIYQKCTPEPSCMPPGTVRLLRRYHPSRDDFAIFPESELAAMVAAGYNSNGGYAPDLGYVYPNVDTDGDDLIDGYELLAGTEATVADSDCDTVSDGLELLDYGATGYGDPLSSPGCNWMSRFVSQSVPTTMAARRVYSVSASFKNVGSQTWTPVGSSPCNDFRIGTSTFGGTSFRGQLPAPVTTGATTSSTFDVVAPTTAGAHTLQLRVLQECVQWFGATSPLVPITVTAAPAKDAQFRIQSVPTTMTAGQTYAVSVRFRNVGTTTWNPVGAAACGNYRLGSWGPMDNTTWGALRKELSATVAPGDAQTISFNVTAPLVPGTYPFQWRMVHECTEWFGDASQVVMVTVTP